jgi:hypothetical protein
MPQVGVDIPQAGASVHMLDVARQSAKLADEAERDEAERTSRIR